MHGEVYDEAKYNQSGRKPNRSSSFLVRLVGQNQCYQLAEEWGLWVWIRPSILLSSTASWPRTARNDAPSIWAVAEFSVAFKLHSTKMLLNHSKMLIQLIIRWNIFCRDMYCYRDRSFKAKSYSTHLPHHMNILWIVLEKLFKCNNLWIWDYINKQHLLRQVPLFYWIYFLEGYLLIVRLIVLYLISQSLFQGNKAGSKALQRQ